MCATVSAPSQKNSFTHSYTIMYAMRTLSIWLLFSTFMKIVNSVLHIFKCICELNGWLYIYIYMRSPRSPESPHCSQTVRLCFLSYSYASFQIFSQNKSFPNVWTHTHTLSLMDERRMAEKNARYYYYLLSYKNHTAFAY